MVHVKDISLNHKHKMKRESVTVENMNKKDAYAERATNQNYPLRISCRGKCRTVENEWTAQWAGKWEWLEKHILLHKNRNM